MKRDSMSRNVRIVPDYKTLLAAPYQCAHEAYDVRTSVYGVHVCKSLTAYLLRQFYLPREVGLKRRRSALRTQSWSSFNNFRQAKKWVAAICGVGDHSTRRYGQDA
jgi:hypothetical protein